MGASVKGLIDIPHAGYLDYSGEALTAIAVHMDC